MTKLRQLVPAAVSGVPFPSAVLAPALLLLGCAMQGVSKEQGATLADTGWAVFNRSYSGERYSPLTQIDSQGFIAIFTLP